MSDCAKSQGAQCWICPQCYDDKHHEPGGMHCLQQQKKEAMAIASLNQLENRSLRQQLAESEARVAELQASCVNLSASLIAAAETEGPIEAIILRKQAEAVEDLGKALHAWVDSRPEEAKKIGFCAGARQSAFSAMHRAKRLHQQAGEAERAGGEQ